MITIACACTFMVVKFFEYQHKFHDGLLPGPNFHPTEQVWELETFRKKHPEAAEYAEKLTKAAEKKAETSKAGAPIDLNKPVTGVFENPTEEQIEPLLKAGVIGPTAEDPTRPLTPRSAPRLLRVHLLSSCRACTVFTCSAASASGSGC